jgi:LSD1 subclass zinc finger protein
MAIEIQCPGCSRTLRVPDEHGGKQVRCPACQQISVAPGGAAAAVAASAADGKWHLRTPDGPTYGPIAWPQVQEWAAEGRITAGCQLADDGDGLWRPATDFFPALQRVAAPAPIAGPPTYPWTAQQVTETSGGVARGYVSPHRGGLILVLGLLGFIMTCPIFSLLAWVMGSHDLNEMRAGRMDRSGEGLTQAGQVLGMILSVFCIGMCVLALFFFLIAAVAGNL